jgi:HAD superfamily hydrolase (TIGR01490 family)
MQSREVLMIGAFFDVVGTVYRGAFWRDISDHHREKKRNRFWTWAYLIWHMAGWPLNLAGLLSDKRWYDSWARDMAWLFRGFSVDEGEELFRWLIEKRVRPYLRTDIMDILRDHQSKDHVVALVSGSPQQVLDSIAADLSIEHALGTSLEVKDERYTGSMTGPLSMGAGKVAAIEDWAAERKLDIDWSESFAYGDGRGDIPLLERVGHPVAVYPDAVLKAVAEERGWQVIGEREPRT